MHPVMYSAVSPMNNEKFSRDLRSLESFTRVVSVGFDALQEMRIWFE